MRGRFEYNSAVSLAHCAFCGDPSLRVPLMYSVRMPVLESLTTCSLVNLFRIYYVSRAFIYFLIRQSMPLGITIVWRLYS
jgi:hypothetical protein